MDLHQLYATLTPDSQHIGNGLIQRIGKSEKYKLIRGAGGTLA